MNATRTSSGRCGFFRVPGAGLRFVAIRQIVFVWTSGAATYDPMARVEMVQKDGPSRAWLIAEFLAIYIVFPCFMFVFRRDLGSFVVPILVVTGTACWAVLRRDGRFNRSRLWSPAAMGRSMKLICIRFAVGATILAFLVWHYAPERLLDLPREHPLVWLAVLVIYPIFSVYPQEIIFRTFLFHRYGPLFGRTRTMIVVSALVFGLAHLFLANWIAPVLSTIGGVLFAMTYARSRSTLQSAIEHGLWGDFLFTLGLGLYFYGGAVSDPAAYPG